MFRAGRLWGMAACLLLSCSGGRGRPPAGHLFETRVALTTSRVLGSPDPPLPYRARRAFPKLAFKNALYMAREPGTDRLLLVEEKGKIHAFPNDPGAARAELYYELKDYTTYSLVHHPDHARNRHVYVFVNGPRPSKRDKNNRILRYRVTEDEPRRIDPRTESLVIEWKSNGHDGGEMAFGPDGYLYITAGDGTTDSDTHLTGQDPSDLCSGLLRIDVDRPEAGRGYAVPKDNPFVGMEGVRPELWAYGFRNPWRVCFDARTGDLWVGDIGQDLWEMVHVVRKGDNYGWSVFEGGHPFNLTRRRGPTPITKPTIVHPHSEARSITGGFVYYGARYPELQGAYLYGDYSTGRVWGARYEGGKVVWHQELADTTSAILGFGQDRAGEIYLVDYAGQIYQLEPSPQDRPAGDFPRTLSESGLFASVPGHRPRPALIPYSVNAQLWSDGAHKERFIALPGTERIEFTENGAWKLPEGTVLVKTFMLEAEAGNPASRRVIETRFLTLQQNEWVGYSYAWDEGQTEGTLVGKEGLHRDFQVREPGGGLRKQTWYYPSRSDCMVCHSRAAGFVLGLNTLQMNRPHDYGRGPEGQLERLEAAGAFQVNYLDHVREMEGRWKRSLPALTPFWGALRTAVTRRPVQVSRLPRRPERYARLADPYDPKEPLASRARAYLHSNCAHCHVEAGGGNSAIDLHFHTTPGRMKLFGERPLHDAFGIKDAELVAFGAPERSILVERLSRRGPGRMPPLATSVVDGPAVRMIEDWIRTLKPRDVADR